MNKKNKCVKKILKAILLVIIFMTLKKCGDTNLHDLVLSSAESASSYLIDKNNTELLYEQIPEFDNKPYCVINNNVPFFSENDITSTPYTQLSELDELGRCGVAMACFGPETIAEGERGSIGHIRPSGWHTVKYDNIDGNYLYNRCHLLMWKLSRILDDERNLITGTRYFNTEGMLYFEDATLDYIYDTNNHVIYRVTPVYKEKDDLVPAGVLMEIKSVEDDELSFCAFVYNNQPGISIDYSTGESCRE